MSLFSKFESMIPKDNAAKELLENSTDPKVFVPKLVALNYDTIIKGVKYGEMLHKSIGAVIEPLNLLKQAAENYKISQADDKETEYIDFLKTNVDAEFLITTLQPIADSLPAGTLIISLLENLVAKQADEKQATEQQEENQ